MSTAVGLSSETLVVETMNNLIPECRRVNWNKFLLFVIEEAVKANATPQSVKKVSDYLNQQVTKKRKETTWNSQFVDPTIVPENLIKTLNVELADEGLPGSCRIVVNWDIAHYYESEEKLLGAYRVYIPTVRVYLPVESLSAIASVVAKGICARGSNLAVRLEAFLEHKVVVAHLGSEEDSITAETRTAN